MLNPLSIPPAGPARKVPGYQMPEDHDQLLSWDFVAEQMAAAEHYWISSVYADGRPHVVPLWGIWTENRVHFDGSTKTTWSQNLMRNPQTAVHLPDGEKVVIIYGTAHIIEDDDIDEQAWHQLDSTFQTKYQVTEGSPYWYVQPQKVLAWNGGKLYTMTRWIFD